MSGESGMATWTDRYWNSADGVKLHYRDHEGNRDRPPILCIPGLTRNARDFEPVADRYAGDWRVLSIDLRGRGGSAFDPDPANYKPMVYVADILKCSTSWGLPMRCSSAPRSAGSARWRWRCRTANGSLAR